MTQTLNPGLHPVGIMPRLGAYAIDLAVLSPFAAAALLLSRQGVILAVSSQILLGLVSTVYYLLLNVYLGATLGKLALGLRIVRTDGLRAGWSEIIKRRSIAMLFMFLVTTGLVVGDMRVDYDTIAALRWLQQSDYLNSVRPAWYVWVGWLQWLWMLAIPLSVRLSSDKRAVHDLIAGTVVATAVSCRTSGST